MTFSIDDDRSWGEELVIVECRREIIKIPLLRIFLRASDVASSTLQGKYLILYSGNSILYILWGTICPPIFRESYIIDGTRNEIMYGTRNGITLGTRSSGKPMRCAYK